MVVVYVSLRSADGGKPTSHHGFRRFEGRRMKDRGNFGAEKPVFLRCDVGKSDRVKPKMSGAFLVSFDAGQKILVRQKEAERNLFI